MRKQNVDKLSEAARALGNEHGQKSARTFINNVPMSKESAEKVITRYQDGDPEIMTLCPKPLSGEWAGDPNTVSVMDEIAALPEAKELLANASIDAAMEATISILDDYENAHDEAFWAMVLEYCQLVVENK
jgi:hypothetical protein